MDSKTVALTANVQSEVRIAQPYKWVCVIEASGEITVVNSLGERMLSVPARTVIPFKGTARDILRLTSTLTETVTIAWGDSLDDMPWLPSLATSGGAGTAAVKGQLAEGTAITNPNDATLFPFVGGSRNWNLAAVRALESVNPQQHIASVAQNVAPLLVTPTRADIFAGTTIAPGATSGEDLHSDLAMVTVSITGTAADSIDVVGQISDSANVTPTVYNLQTGLPTAVAGRMTVPGQYFYFTEGFSRTSLIAPVGNAGTTTVRASASAACRPALIPVALRDESGSAFSDSNPLPAQTDPLRKVTYSGYFSGGGNYNGFIFDFPAAVGKTVRIKKVEFDSVASALGHNDIYLAKYSTAPTGGTTSAIASAPHVSTDAAAAAAPLNYTAVQATTGALVAIVRLTKQTQVLPGTTVLAPVTAKWHFGDLNDKELILVAGSTEHIALVCNGPAGFVCTGFIEWTEE